MGATRASRCTCVQRSGASCAAERADSRAGGRAERCGAGFGGARRGGSAMISAEQRAEIRRLFYAEHWKVAHDRVGAVGPPRHGAAGDRSGALPRTPGAAEANEGRCVPALYPGDAGDLPAASLDAPLRDAAPARVHRLAGATAAGGAPHASSADGGGVPATARDGGRASAGRLGLLRMGGHGPSAPSVVLFRDGALVVARHPCALHVGSNDGELRARARRGLRLLRRGPRAVLYDNLKSAVLFAARRRDSVSSTPSGALRSLPLRPAPVRAGPG